MARREGAGGTLEARPQAVGPLLAFHNPSREAAFQQHFVLCRLPQDTFHIGRAVPFALLAGTKFWASGERAAACVMAVESLWFALLTWAAACKHPVYLRFRSVLLGCFFHVPHFLACWFVARAFYPSGCGSVPFFWLRELMLGLVPWTAILALALPPPLKHAVWVHAAQLAAATACTGRRLRLSESFCAQTGERYSAVHWLLGVLAAMLSPTPMVGVAMGWRPDGAAAFARLSIGLHFVWTFALPLDLIYRQEWRLRAAFAQQQGWAAELAGLRSRRCPWSAWLGLEPLP